MRNVNFSVITTTYNSGATVHETLASVQMQRGVCVEHIVKDAGSTDGTVEIVRNGFPSAVVVSRSDSGIYDGMNQGFRLATGDIVAFLNGDDAYVGDDALYKVYEAFTHSSCDYVYANVDMIDASGRVRRRYTSQKETGLFNVPLQFPHPALFIRRSLLAEIGGPFDPTYRIAADLKLQLEIRLRRRAKGEHLPQTIVKMRLGGASTAGVRNYLRGWRESARAYREYAGARAWPWTLIKVVSKASQYFDRRNLEESK